MLFNSLGNKVSPGCRTKNKPRVLGFTALALLGLLLVSCPSGPAPLGGDGPVEGPGRDPDGPVAPVELPQAVLNYENPEDSESALAELENAAAGRQLQREELLIRGALLLSRGRTEEAQALFEELLEADPQDRDALLNLAYLALSRNQFPRALAFLEQILDGNPEDAEALAAQGQVLLIQGQVPAARASFERSLGIMELPEALSGLASIEVLDENPDRALELLDQALELDEGNDYYYSQRAQVQLSRQAFFRAEEDLDQALALNPDNPWHLLDRARLRWLHLYKDDEAMADLNQLLEQDEDNFYGLLYRAEILNSWGRVAESLADYRQVLAQRPDFHPVYADVALLAFADGDYPLALQMAQPSLERYPGEYAFAFITALTLRQQGEAQESRRILEEGANRHRRNELLNQTFRTILNPRELNAFRVLYERETDPLLKIRVRFYQAASDLLAGQPRSARVLLEEVADSELQNIPEIAMAQHMLLSLQ